MSDTTNIGWTEHTGGPWLICTEVSPGCVFCYSRELMQRRLKAIVRKAYQAAGFPDWETRPVWGDKAPRVLTKGFWHQAERINAAHAKAGTRGLWFPSLIDWLDLAPAGIINQDGEWLDVNQVRADFLNLIRRTPNLTWQILTKRPENFLRCITDALWHVEELPTDCDGSGTFPTTELGAWLNEWTRTDGEGAPANVYVGVTVEDQTRADERIPHLLSIPARVRFLSCEPLLEPVNLTYCAPYTLDGNTDNPGYLNAFNGMSRHPKTVIRESNGRGTAEGIQWVIAGCESGAKKRPMEQDWARSLATQCATAGVAFFMKQMVIAGQVSEDLTAFPEALQVRQFPEVTQ